MDPAVDLRLACGRFFFLALLVVLTSGCGTGEHSPEGIASAGGAEAAAPRLPTRLPKNAEGITPSSQTSGAGKEVPIRKLAAIPEVFETGVLYLGADRREVSEVTSTYHKPFQLEVWRQAVMLAAEHELGLIARDSSFSGDASEDDRRRFGELRLRGFCDQGVKFVFLDEGSSTAANEDGLVLAQSPNTGAPGFILRSYVDLTPQIVALEKMSREEFPRVLQEVGYRGEPPKRNPAAAVPAGVEAKLTQMHLVPQFAALRELEAALRQEGESPAILGALVRCHANLGVLTEHFWSMAPLAHKARALLYLQRLKMVWPDSPQACGDRASAMAMMGMHRLAREELDKAEKLSADDGGDARSPLPPALVQSSADYDVDALLAVGDDQAEPLREVALLMAVQAAEAYEDDVRLQAAARRAWTAMPDCGRVYLGAVLLGTIGLQAEAAAAIEGNVLPSLEPLKALEGLPKPALAGLSGDLTPQRTAQLVRQLRESGDPLKDRRFASWDMLGQMFAEDAFGKMMLQLDYLRATLCADPSAARSVITRYEPLLGSNPCWGAAEAWSVEPTPENLGPPLSRFRPVQMTVPMMRMTRFGMTWIVPVRLPIGATIQDQVLANAYFHAVGGARGMFDMTAVIKEGHVLYSSSRHILAASPNHPFGVARDVVGRIRLLMEADPDLVNRYIDRPEVALCAADYHEKRWEYERAVEVLEKLAETSPSSEGYRRLAELHLRRSDVAAAAHVGNEMLRKAPAGGLKKSVDAALLARRFIQMRRFAEAEPLAEFAAGSFAADCLEICGSLYGHQGRWDEFNAVLRAFGERYGFPHWYLQCRAFGSGDLAGARRLGAALVPPMFASAERRPRRIAAAYLALEGRPAEAVEGLFQGSDLPRQVLRVDDTNEPLDYLLGAVLADPDSQASLRDYCLAGLDKETLGNESQGSAERMLAKEFIACLKDRPEGGLDTAYVDGILEGSTRAATLFAMAALFCEKYTTEAQALRFGEKSLRLATLETGYDALCCELLRRHGVDPIEIVANPRRPSGGVDELTVEVRVVGRVELVIKEDGIQMLLHDGPIAGTKLFVEGEPWEPRWTEFAFWSSHGPRRTSVFPHNIGEPVFDIGCEVSDARDGPPSDRPCRVQYAPDWNCLRILLEDQPWGAGWYTLTLRRRTNPGGVWPESRYVVVDRLRPGLQARNPDGGFDAPRFGARDEFSFVMPRVGEKTTLRLWLTRRLDVPIRGTVTIERGAETRGKVCNLEKLGPIPLGVTMDQAKLVEFDVSREIDEPGYYRVEIELPGAGKMSRALQIRRVELDSELPPAAAAP